MVCQACGAPLSAGIRFCSRCGAAATPEQAGAGGGGTGTGPVNPQYGGSPYAGAPYAYAAPMVVPRPPRVAQHVRTLGILWLCFGVWRVLGGLIGMFFLSAITTHRFAGWGIPFPWDRHSLPPMWMGWMVPMIAVGTVITGGLAFATAYGLLQRKSWGRILAMIAGILALIKFPLGTAIGIYTLWVLAPAASAAEYDYVSSTTGT